VFLYSIACSGSLTRKIKQKRCIGGGHGQDRRESGSGDAPVAVQGAGHAFKIQARNLGNVLAPATRLLMALKQSVGARVIFPKPIQFFNRGGSDEMGAFREGAPLLPEDQSFLTFFEEKLVLRANPDLGRYCGWHGVPPF
jgi:hypothetical protein